jgi:hypothetical protein
MRIRIAQPKLRPFMGVAALLGPALTFAYLPGAAQQPQQTQEPESLERPQQPEPLARPQQTPQPAPQWTQEQRTACEPDAIRLCEKYIPDIDRIRTCMAHNRRYLTPECRAQFGGGQTKKR